jgi:hypothetical protein
LEEYLDRVDLEAINLMAVNLEAVNLESVDQEALAMLPDILSIGWLVIVGIQRIEYNVIPRELSDGLEVLHSQSCDDAVGGVCSTQCMLFLVHAVLSVNS